MVAFLDSDVLVKVFAPLVEDICARAHWRVQAYGTRGKVSYWGVWALRNRHGDYLVHGTLTKLEAVARLLVMHPAVLNDWTAVIPLAVQFRAPPVQANDSLTAPVMPVATSSSAVDDSIPGGFALPFREIDLAAINNMLPEVALQPGFEPRRLVLARGGGVPRCTWKVKWTNAIAAGAAAKELTGFAFTSLEAVAMAHNLCVGLKLDWRQAVACVAVRYKTEVCGHLPVFRFLLLCQLDPVITVWLHQLPHDHSHRMNVAG
jgi:hypothetical protein